MLGWHHFSCLLLRPVHLRQLLEQHPSCALKDQHVLQLVLDGLRGGVSTAGIQLRGESFR